MRKALDGVPETYPTAPPGLIRVQPTGATTEEMIYQENLPAVPPEVPNEPANTTPADETPAPAPTPPAAAAPPAAPAIPTSPQ